MINSKKDKLIELISVLTKGEKRHFKRNSIKSGRVNTLYVQLFDYLDKYKTKDERHLLRKIPLLRKSQLSNIKANLYRQILRSLRDINKEQYAEIKAREHFDFAKILYSKGLYVRSLQMLEKVKKMAHAAQNKPLKFLALSFEKHIESQHVTGSMSPKAKILAHESNELVDALILRNQLSNLSLNLYGMYLKKGYVKTEEDRKEVLSVFEQNLPSFKYEELDFYQKLFLIQSHVWLNNSLQNFANYFKWSQRWIDLFEEFPEMKIPETSIYIKGLHNLLNALFMLNRTDRFEKVLSQLINLNVNNELKLSRNEESQWLLFKYTHGINHIFLSTEYTKNIGYFDELEKILIHQNHPWDLHRKLTFHYKLACAYFGTANLDKTIFHLSFITNFSFPDFKEDLQCFARILKLIAHYDQGDEFLVSYQVRSVYRFLLKMKELQKTQKEILKFIRKINDKHVVLEEEFKILRKKLLPLEDELLERRPFLYLDIISWLDSKILNTTMVMAIRKRRAILN